MIHTLEPREPRFIREIRNNPVKSRSIKVELNINIIYLNILQTYVHTLFELLTCQTVADNYQDATLLNLSQKFVNVR